MSLKYAYSIQKKDSRIPPIALLFRKSISKFTHEQHKYIAVSIAGGQGYPDFTFWRHCSDDVHLLAQRLIWRWVI